jgi:hypothetical protein
MKRVKNSAGGMSQIFGRESASRKIIADMVEGHQNHDNAAQDIDAIQARDVEVDPPKRKTCRATDEVGPHTSAFTEPPLLGNKLT